MTATTDLVGTTTSTTVPSDLFAPADPTAPADVVADRLLAAALGAMETSAVYLGGRLGWYRTLAETGPLTSAELAHATGTAERYAREWLEQQAATGYVAVVPDGPDAADPRGSDRRYRLHPGAAEALTDVDSLAHLAPLAQLLAASGRAVDALAEAYRTGGGVSWEELGEDARASQSALNRPFFLHALTQEVTPALPELHARLLAGAAVADVGCGEAWSAIGLALGYPAVRVDGYDVDAPSVEAARRHAAAAGVSDRVAVTTADAADVTPGRYDVVAAFECVHDMSDPVAVLRSMRAMAGADGYVLVMDERTEDGFTPRAGVTERLLYGFSLLCCLPDGLSRAGGVGTGTVMRPHVLAGYAAEAGFSRTEVLPVEHDVFRFYRLHP